MKTKTTRILCALLALLMLTACCVGCGKNTPVPASSGDSSDASDTPVKLLPDYLDENLTELSYVADGIVSYRDAKTGRLGLLNGDCEIILPAEYTAVKFCVAGNGCMMTLPDGRVERYDPANDTLEEGDFCAHGGVDAPYIWNADMQCAVEWNDIGEVSPVPAERLPQEGEAFVVQSDEDEPKYGILGSDGKLVTALVFEQASDFVDGLCAVCRDGMWGYVNAAGREVIGFYYSPAYTSVGCLSYGVESAYDSSHGYIAAIRDGILAGLLDSDGSLATSFSFRDILPLGNGKFAALYNNKWVMGTPGELSRLD